MLSICLVCDFFYPAVGGCEVHVFTLGSHMAVLGHRVTILTHAAGDRIGVRYLESGVKVYYIAQLPFYNNTSFPTLFSTLPVLRSIFIREAVQIVHGHSAFSVLAHEVRARNSHFVPRNEPHEHGRRFCTPKPWASAHALRTIRSLDFRTLPPS
jgi:hypothetical protein